MGVTGIESRVGKGSTRGPLLLNHMPLLWGKTACLSRGRPDLSDLPDLNDRLQGNGKRNKAEARLTHTSGVCVPLPPAVPVWPCHGPIKEAESVTAEGCPPRPQSECLFIRTPASLLLHSKKIANN